MNLNPIQRRLLFRDHNQHPENNNNNNNNNDDDDDDDEDLLEQQEVIHIEDIRELAYTIYLELYECMFEIVL